MLKDFKSDGLMLALVALIIAFVVVQSIFFMKKAWNRGKELGITTEKLKNTVTSSAVFSIAPAIGIAVTVIALAGTLGYVLPWIRLTVIGSISYETAAAEAALEATGATSITDPTVFSTIAWVMTLGSILPLILIPILIKKVQKTVSGTVSKNGKWADLMSAAAFIGLIAAFLGRGIAGVGKLDEAGNNAAIGDGAGVLSLTAIISSVGFMLIFSLINRKLKKNWIDALAMPVSMVLAMVVVVLVSQFTPESFWQFEWRY